jgi:hypothetical protein
MLMLLLPMMIQQSLRSFNKTNLNFM